ncbi:unnamed protein product [Lepeophtheirus salmonis]|uniref:(salmon louse) hypothetical protein n=1 Tax=Lepeophtheirus salmonis TaxID=72036 RepID=A0A7R8H9K6_LEPSM|nr:unnamed protein product [Lepeophtheirus salmonis]CAF2956458.1 unnamed protein product [Lepeophtheirus salmonis]
MTFAILQHVHQTPSTFSVLTRRHEKHLQFESNKVLHQRKGEWRSKAFPSSARNVTIPSKSHPGIMVRKIERKNANPKANTQRRTYNLPLQMTNPYPLLTLKTLSATSTLPEEEAERNHDALVNELLVKQTKASTDLHNEFQTTLVRNAYHLEDQMNAQTNSLLEQMRGLLSQSTTADTKTSTTQTSFLAFQPTARESITSCTSNLTDLLSGTYSVTGVTSELRAQNFASFPHEQQIWTFLSVLEMHDKLILEYSYKIYLKLSDLTVNVLLENLQSSGGKSQNRLTDPPSRSPRNKFNMSRQYQDIDHLVDLKSQSTAPHRTRMDPSNRVKLHKTHLPSKQACCANVTVQHCHFFSMNGISLGSLRNVLLNSDASANLISTQNAERLGFNINTVKKPEGQLKFANNLCIDIIGEM